MARRLLSGDLQLGFDMAPVLPKQRQASTPTPTVDGVTRPTSLIADQHSPTSGPRSSIPASRTILTVAQLTRRITSLLEKEIGEVCVDGEISNFRRQSSGHCYFTLKDAESQLPCVLFARAASLQGIEPRDGMQVRLTGDLSVYLARGQYQLIVRAVEATGEGVLRARFEELKSRLTAEGLFDPGKKLPLPRFPRRVGVVTSPTGAALQDFLNVLHRRHPGLSVVISPVRVQGKGAADEIARAVLDFSTNAPVIGEVDVIVVTRGGGSLEDLWEFNEEVVARAIAASTIPVVSAVGHEIDFTITDFAADLRAPTPSAAAELIAADAVAILERSRSMAFRIAREASSALERASSRVALAASGDLFREPRRRMEEAWQGIDRCEEILGSALSEYRERCRSRVENLAIRLRGSYPGHAVETARRVLLSSERRFAQVLTQGLDRERGRVSRCDAVLSAVDPAATLRRGFSITRTTEGRVVTSTSSLSLGETLTTTLADGTVSSVILET
jgi:exodeoxyribonuclease VII large subunit